MSCQRKHRRKPARERQAIIDRRLAAVQLWRGVLTLAKSAGVKEPEATAAAVQLLSTAGIRTCRATLFNWEQALRKDGVPGLADHRGESDRLKRFGAFFLALERVFTRRGLPSIEMAHLLAAEQAKEKGWNIPTIRESRRYLKRYILPGLTRERGGTIGGQFDGRSSDN